MRKLIKGIINFRQKSITKYRHKFSKLALQQSPDALFVACCDSRVVPNVFASSDPGDLFVLRNIGNLIPPHKKNLEKDTSVSSTIEFALKNLNVSDIVICGHSECGAMQSLIENNTQANSSSSLSSLNSWLEYAAPSYKRFQSNSLANNDENISPCNHLSQVNVLQQLDHLKTYPMVKKRLRDSTLRIHGWWFDLATANIFYYNPTLEKFILLDEAEAKTLLASFD